MILYTEGFCNGVYADTQKETVHVYHGGDNFWIYEKVKKAEKKNES